MTTLAQIAHEYQVGDEVDQIRAGYRRAEEVDQVRQSYLREDEMSRTAPARVSALAQELQAEDAAQNPSLLNTLASAIGPGEAQAAAVLPSDGGSADGPPPPLVYDVDSEAWAAPGMVDEAEMPPLLVQAKPMPGDRLTEANEDHANDAAFRLMASGRAPAMVSQWGAFDSRRKDVVIPYSRTRKFRHMFMDAAGQNANRADVLQAMAMVESSGIPTARNKNTSAKGLMQLMPGAISDIEDKTQYIVANPLDAKQSIEGAKRYLDINRRYLKKFLPKGHKITLADELGAYYMGAKGHAMALKGKYPNLQRIKERDQYVHKILSVLNIFQQMRTPAAVVANAPGSTG